MVTNEMKFKTTIVLLLISVVLLMLTFGNKLNEPWKIMKDSKETIREPTVNNNYNTETMVGSSLTKSTKVPCQPISGINGLYKGAYSLDNCPVIGQKIYYCDAKIVSKEQFMVCED